MSFGSRPNHNFTDPENFPPPRGIFDMLPESFKMPDFIKNDELRKGPRQQDTLTWMNAVQACLDDFTSWDRRLNGKIGVRVHGDVKLCQIARISPRAIKNPFLKVEAIYIKEDLQPAIDLLDAHEKMRLKELDKLRAGNAKPTEKQSNNKKRKQEDEAETQSAMKKRKQQANQKLNDHVNRLQALRKLVNEKLGAADIDISKRFHMLEGEILELMAAED